MDEITIRPATPADATEVSDLIRRTVRRSNAPDYGGTLAERIADNFTSDKVVAWLAERDVFVCQTKGRIVGTVGLGGKKLRALFVEPGLQRGGIGARLVAHLETHARQIGVNELTLHSSLTAHGFYERLGYRTIRFEERADGSTWLMTKTLA